MKKLLPLVLLWFCSFTQAQIVINEVRETGAVELKNLGSTTVDISSYWLCDVPSYRQLTNASITVESGSLNLAPNAIVEISGFDFIDSADGELGLYSTNSFGSANAIVDYIQWGSGNHGRANVAATAGVWSSASDFIPAFDENLSLQYSGVGEAPSSYVADVPTLGQDNSNICNAVAGDIRITASSASNTTSVASDGLSAVICVDNQADDINVDILAGSVGSNFGFIITDAATNNILGTPSNGPFNLNGAGTGTCEIWYVRYENDFSGNIVGNNLSDLEGCFDLSNPVAVIREAADAGTIAIDADATGNPNNTTTISEDGLSAVICIDNLGDPLVVTHDNLGATNLSYRYVITNEDASEILNITNSSAIDLSVAGTGTCQIWGWSYRGLADNGASFIGGPLSALRAVDTCSDVSTMAITVIREAADAGTIAIDAEATGNPNNTTSISEDGLSAVICIDNLGDPLVVTHENPGATNLSYRYVITNEDASEILNITNSSTIDLSVAGTGTCQIWGWSYRGLADNGASFIGGPLSALRAVETCSDVSTMAITVIREAADAGTIAIDADATGNPNNTTTISEDGLSAVICIDNLGDPLVVTHDNPGATNLSYRYVITNEDASEILNITNSSSIDLSVAGTGTCQIWGWSYRGLADNGASFIGGPLSALRAVDTCSDVSTMAITVIREAADAGTIAIDAEATGNPNNTTTISEDGLSAVICIDNLGDPLVVTNENPGATNLSYRYVITNEDASEILNITNSSAIDLSVAGTGTCQIWGWSYRGLADDGASFIGGPLSALRAVDTCSDVSTMAITVIREAADAGTIGIDVEATSTANGTVVNSATSATIIAGDNLPNPLVVTHDNPSATNLSYRYVITNEDASEILGITNSIEIDLEGAGAGTCQIWGWSYRGLADNGASFIGGPLSALRAVETCSDVSDMAITVVRNAFVPVTDFTARLSGTQENPAALTTAYGSISATLNGNMLTVTGSFSGLTSDFDANVAGGAHIHRAIAGRNGGVELLLTTTVSNDLRSGTYEAMNNTFMLTDAQLMALQARELYVNIHSVAFPAGEIRGQIVPTSDQYLQANLLGSNEVPSISTEANGNLILELTGNMLTVTGSFDDLSGDIAVDLAGGAHIHDAVAGRNGDVTFILNLTADDDNRGAVLEAVNNTFMLTEDQLATLMAQGYYVNVHSTAFMPGELRGQITPLASAIFRAELTGTQEVPAVNTSATGRLMITHDGFGNVTVSGSFNNLSGDLNTELAGGIHLHPGVAGTNAGVDFILTPTLDDNRNAVLLPANNTFTFTPEQIETLFNRGYYVNVHSLNFVPGEIRGQVLPLARTYLGTSLSGANELQPVVTTGVGNLQFEITGNQLVVTGGFSALESDFDANLAGGSHLHIADAANNGDVTILLNATVAEDLRSGVYNAASNTFELTEAQLTNLLTGNVYVNIHTIDNAPGELRGQVLRDDNAFPTASEIASPENDASIAITDDAETPFAVNWSQATDVNNDLLVYTFQLATDASFETLLVNNKVGTALSFETTNAIVDGILADVGVTSGESITLYHRVLASDGSVSTPSAAFTIELTRDTTLNINNVDVDNAFRVYPNPTRDIVRINATSASRNVVITLFDVTGKQLYNTTVNMNNGAQQVNLSAFKQGVYVLNINDLDTGSTLTKRIIKN